MSTDPGLGQDLSALWVYLGTSPLLWLTATLAAYVIGDRLSRLCNRHPLVNPVAIAAGLLVGLLSITETPYTVYFEGAQFVHFLLGPATVALAIPLVENFGKVRRALPALIGALFVGAVTAIGSAVLLAHWAGADTEVTLSLAVKSVTAPIAMSLAESLGGLPRMAAVLVTATGIVGAVMITPLMNAMGIKDMRARGLAVGVVSHGIGTARAFSVHPVAGVFAGIGMGLNGLLTAAFIALWPWVS